MFFVFNKFNKKLFSYEFLENKKVILLKKNIFENILKKNCIYNNFYWIIF